MDTIFSFDAQLFLFINYFPHTGVTDAVAKFFSLIGSAGLIWFMIGFLLFLKEEKKHHLFFAPIVAAGGVSYVLVEYILKPLFARPRPTPILSDYSFPSGHATIAFAMAVVLSSYEPKLKWVFYILALCIAFSRIFVGAHYPLDVFGGAILGIIIAWLNLMLGSFVRRRWIPKLPDLSKRIR